MSSVKFKDPIRGLSMFSNVGLAETYLRELGIEIVVANELLEERAKFYKHLYPQTNMIVGDITEPSIFESVVTAAKEAQVDFLIATPPCQGMSCAGSKDPNDPRNFLIYYAIEAIKVHGAFKGSLLAIWRILRCNPLCKGGYDPVPEKKQKTKF